MNNTVYIKIIEDLQGERFVEKTHVQEISAAVSELFWENPKEVEIVTRVIGAEMIEFLGEYQKNRLDYFVSHSETPAFSSISMIATCPDGADVLTKLYEDRIRIFPPSLGEEDRIMNTLEFID